MTTPMNSGARDASSTRLNRKGELREKRETERVVVTAVVADASTPSSLSSTVLAWRIPATFRGASEIRERSGVENREPRPAREEDKQSYRLKVQIVCLRTHVVHLDGSCGPSRTSNRRVWIHFTAKIILALKFEFGDDEGRRLLTGAGSEPEEKPQ